MGSFFSPKFHGPLGCLLQSYFCLVLWFARVGADALLFHPCHLTTQGFIRGSNRCIKMQSKTATVGACCFAVKQNSLGLQIEAAFAKVACGILGASGFARARGWLPCLAVASFSLLAAGHSAISFLTQCCRRDLGSVGPFFDKGSFLLPWLG